MNWRLRDSLLQACCVALVPLARICIRAGISHKEFVNVSRVSFVRAAAKELSGGAKKLTNSRIATRTGLTRREVSQAKGFHDVKGEYLRSCLPLTFILTQWHTNPKYTGEDGMPVQLPLRSGNELSLEGLVREVMPDLPVGSVIDELISYKAIEKSDEDVFSVVAREFVPTTVDPLVIKQAGLALLAHGTSIVENLFATDAAPRFFERMAVSSKLADGAVPKFLMQANQNAKGLLEMTDSWINANESAVVDDKIDRLTGLGIYTFDLAEKQEQMSTDE